MKEQKFLIVKGTVSKHGDFFESLNILISPLCVCGDGFQCRSEAFHFPIQLLTFLFACKKLLVYTALAATSCYQTQRIP
jgi:hypothetical protein